MDKIQYLRKNGRNKGKKKGVIVAVPIDDENLAIGFSLCHVTDRFDYINNQRHTGFGVGLAKKRAVKMIKAKDFVVQNTHTEDQIDKFIDGEGRLMEFVAKTPDVVVVPPSVMRELKDFIQRCKLYYKDKTFPMWIQKIEAGTDAIGTNLIGLNEI